MVKGDMLLKIMEHGQPKDVHIREGEVWGMGRGGAEGMGWRNAKDV